MSSSVTPPQVHSTWNATIRTILGASLVVVLVLLAFGWPTYTAKVKDMPLGVVATSEQQAQLQQALDAADDPFELTSYPGTAEAEEAIKQREVYGAVIMPTAKLASCWSWHRMSMPLSGKTWCVTGVAPVCTRHVQTQSSHGRRAGMGGYSW